MSGIRDKKWYPWLVVVLLSGVAFLNYMDRQMLSTMRFAMSEDIMEVATLEGAGPVYKFFHLLTTKKLFPLFALFYLFATL